MEIFFIFPFSGFAWGRFDDISEMPSSLSLSIDDFLFFLGVGKAIFFS